MRGMCRKLLQTAKVIQLCSLLLVFYTEVAGEKAFLVVCAGRIHRQSENEIDPAAFFGLNPYFSAVLGDDLPGNEQTQACTANRVGIMAEPNEFSEQTGGFFGR